MTTTTKTIFTDRYSVTTTLPRPTFATTTTATSRTATTSTRLYMFDWLQRKPGTSHSKQQPQNDNPLKEAEDFVANFFQGLSGGTKASRERKQEVHHHTAEHQQNDQQHTLKDVVTIEDTDHNPSPTIPVVVKIMTPIEAHHDDTHVEIETSSTAEATTMVSPIAPPAIVTHSGHVAWFDRDKGYGFLVMDDHHDSHGKDKGNIFVHYSSISTHYTSDEEGSSSSTHDDHGLFRNLLKHEAVEFQLEETSQGRFKAVHVTGPNGMPVQYIQKQLAKKKVRGGEDAGSTR